MSWLDALSIHYQRPVQKTRRAFAYLRVSTDDQDERKQRGVIEQWATHHGVEIVAWYADHGESAFRDDAQRPQFWRLIEDAERVRPQYVLVKDSSRWSRRSDVAVTTKGRLARAGVRVVAVTEWTPSSNPVSDLWLSRIHETRSEAESLINRMHTLDGMRAHCQQRDPTTGWAYKCGGRAPFGFKSVRVPRGVDKKGQIKFGQIWELDDTVQSGRTNAEWRRMICEWRLAGASLNVIRDRLNVNNVKTLTGRAWSRSSVYSLLEPSAVIAAAGHYCWNRGTKKHHRGSNLKPMDEWVVVENAHPALISDEDARRLIAMVRHIQSGQRHDKENSPWLLSGGIFKCGGCGANMVGYEQKGFRYYVCGSYRYRGGVDCPWPRTVLPADQIERDMLERSTDLFDLSESRLRRIVARYNEKVRQYNARIDRSRYRKELRRVETELARLTNAIKAGVAVPTILSEIQRLEQERLEIKDTMQLTRPMPELTENDLLRTRAEVLKTIEEGSNKLRRRLLRSQLAEITLNAPDRELTLRYQKRPEFYVISLVAPRDDFDADVIRVLRFETHRRKWRSWWVKRCA